jgi:exodeoxyribonuclease V beta subunit
MDPQLDIHDLAAPLDPGATLIEASAGTGKTYTIAAIFLRLIVEHALTAEQILVTTFTIPATAELRDRIRRVLRRALRAFREKHAFEPMTQALLEKYSDRADEIAARLQAALLDFDQARISTIHGFCQRVLQECAFESGSAPETEFVEDESTLMAELVRDFWRQQFYECEECLAAAARCAKLSLESLTALLDLRLKKPLARIIPESKPGTLERLRDEIVAKLDEVRTCWAAGQAAITAPFVSENTWAKKPFSDEAANALLLESVAKCLHPSAPSLARYDQLLLLSRSSVENGKRVRATAPAHLFHDLCEELCTLGKEYKRAVEWEFLRWAPAELVRRKVRANVTAYSDLLGRLHAELESARGPALIARIRQQYRAALIDEFQDTDAVQEAIFQRIFGGKHEGADPHWLFLIGDPKQAIYGFRGADVFSYLDAAGRAERRRTLRTNFRSTQALVDGVNAVFSQNKDAFVVDGIGFDPGKASGKNERPFTGDGIVAPLRIWAWQGDAETNADDLKGELARATAAEIARLLADGGRIGDEPVRPADIAVLTGWNEEAAYMQEELRRADVASVVLSMSSVFASREATELLQLLAAIAQPTQEKLVRGALLTDLLGATAAGLHAMAADEAGWDAWLQRFHGWHEAWTRRGFIGAFRRVMNELELRRHVVSFEDGERRLTNLVHLSELVQRAASDGQLSPKATVDWLARRVAEAAGQSRAKEEDYELRLERDDEAVRIVTVHKSKGLEYPIVFCPFSWKQIAGKPKTPERATFHNDEREVVLDTGSPEVSSHLDRERTERLAEEVRLLYVALTRAKVRCDFALPFTGKATRSAATWLLQNPPPEAARDVDLLGTRIQELQATGWYQNLQNLADSAPDSIAIVEVPPITPPPVVAKKSLKAPAALAARAFTARIETDFCVSSFSSLTADASADVPEQYVAPAGEEPLPKENRTDIHAFPAGARPGLCLHEIFERLDFSKPENLDALVHAKLTDYSLEPTRWTPAVAQCIRHVLDVPLADGFSLNSIASRERLTEREFHLQAGRLEPRELRRILGSGEEPGGLDFSARRGWLKGFIDLIFRQDGRFYIADWKSNRLGAGPAAYVRESIDASMRAHHYGLQAHLYALALHRYLQQRQRGYDYERHFGGIYYFFLRGVDPATPELGIWRERPTFETIQSLERWLKGGAQ